MMKKIKWLIPAVIVGAVIVALIALLPLALRHGSSSGYYLEAKDGAAMIIVGNSPIQMSNQTNRDLFKGFENGDRITVLHGAVAESYPGRTGVYAVLRHKRGNAGDIPQTVINSLMSMGWLDGGFEAAYTSPEDAFIINVAYAGWSEDSKIYTSALNTEKMAISSIQHLPIYRLDTLADVEAFRSTFENDLAFEYGFDEIKSFNDTIAVFADEAYLKAYSLMVVYVNANSGTYRYGVESIFCNGEQFTVNVEKLNHPEVVTADLAGWYIIVVVPDSMIVGCTEFDAFLG